MHPGDTTPRLRWVLRRESGRRGVREGTLLTATPLTRCFEQAPEMKYSFLAMVGRRYLITWVDQNWIRRFGQEGGGGLKSLVTADRCSQPPPPPHHHRYYC